MIKEEIWLALVGVKQLQGNEYLNSIGAYVNVACLAKNKTDFIAKLHGNFMHNRFEIFEIDDIEQEKNLVISDEANAEKLNLINEINKGYKFAWGVFHTFDS